MVLHAGLMEHSGAPSARDKWDEAMPSTVQVFNGFELNTQTGKVCFTADWLEKTMAAVEAAKKLHETPISDLNKLIGKLLRVACLVPLLRIFINSLIEQLRAATDERYTATENFKDQLTFIQKVLRKSPGVDARVYYRRLKSHDPRVLALPHVDTDAATGGEGCTYPFGGAGGIFADLVYFVPFTEAEAMAFDISDLEAIAFLWVIKAILRQRREYMVGQQLRFRIDNTGIEGAMRNMNGSSPLHTMIAREAVLLATEYDFSFVTGRVTTVANAYADLGSRGKIDELRRLALHDGLHLKCLTFYDDDGNPLPFRNIDRFMHFTK